MQYHDHDDAVYTFAEIRPGSIKPAETKSAKTKSSKNTSNKLRGKRFIENQPYDTQFTRKNKPFLASRKLPIKNNSIAADVVSHEDIYPYQSYPAIAHPDYRNTHHNATVFVNTLHPRYNMNAPGLQPDIDVDLAFFLGKCLNSQGIDIEEEGILVEEASVFKKVKEEYTGDKHGLDLFLKYYCELRKIILDVDKRFISKYTVLYYYFCYYLFNSSTVEENVKIIEQLKSFFEELKAEAIEKNRTMASILKEHNDNDDDDYTTDLVFDELVTKLNNRFYTEGKGATRIEKSNRFGGRKTKRSKRINSSSRKKIPKRINTRSRRKIPKRINSSSRRKK